VLCYRKRSRARVASSSDESESGERAANQSAMGTRLADQSTDRITSGEQPIEASDQSRDGASSSDEEPILSKPEKRRILTKKRQKSPPKEVEWTLLRIPRVIFQSNGTHLVLSFKLHSIFAGF